MTYRGIGLASKMEDGPTILQMRNLRSREYNVSIIYCYVTKHSKTEQFKP